MKRLMTALITPFQEDGRLDEPFLHQLLTHQQKGGVESLLALGSTAESYALSMEEKKRLLEIIADFTKAHKMELCVNVSSNVTSDSQKMAEMALEMGATSLLMLPPFYVSLTEKAQFQHFEAVANTTKLPIIIYNHPGRTGVHIAFEQLQRLSQVPTIMGIKEASSQMHYTQSILTCMPEFLFYAGDDSMTLPTMSMGGFGLISVLSNLFPRAIGQLVERLGEQDLKRARELNKTLEPLFAAMSLAPNPALIKALMARRMGMSSRVRRPLLEVDETVDAALDRLFEQEEVASCV